MQNDLKTEDKIFVKDAHVNLDKSEIELHCFNQEAFDELHGYLRMQVFQNTDGRTSTKYEIKVSEKDNVIRLINDKLIDIINLLLQTKFISHTQAESLQHELSHNQHTSSQCCML